MSIFNAFSQNCTADYEEINNIVVIEAENIDNKSTWSVETAAAGYSGSGYIEWGQGNYFNNPGNGLISVKIKINSTGIYKFQWRNKIGEGSSTTDENDSWLRFPDASLNYAAKGGENGSKIYPKGSGQSPNPNGAGSNGWWKVYSNTIAWSWATRTSDNDPHEIYVQFDNPGVYTMEISARSNFHFIDRIVLSKSSVSNPTDLNNSETPCANSLSTSYIDDIKNNIKVFPNPVNSSNNIYISGIPQDIYNVQIIDLRGKLMKKEIITIKNNVEEFQIENLKSGVYFLTLTSRSNTPFSTKFIVD